MPLDRLINMVYKVVMAAGYSIEQVSVSSGASGEKKKPGFDLKRAAKALVSNIAKFALAQPGERSASDISKFGVGSLGTPRREGPVK